MSSTETRNRYNSLPGVQLFPSIAITLQRTCLMLQGLRKCYSDYLGILQGCWVYLLWDGMWSANVPWFQRWGGTLADVEGESMRTGIPTMHTARSPQKLNSATSMACQHTEYLLRLSVSVPEKERGSPLAVCYRNFSQYNVYIISRSQLPSWWGLALAVTPTLPSGWLHSSTCCPAN